MKTYMKQVVSDFDIHQNYDVRCTCFCLPASHAFISGVWRPQAVQPHSNHSVVSNACIVHSSQAAKHTVREVDICHKWSQMAHVLV